MQAPARRSACSRAVLFCRVVWHARPLFQVFVKHHVLLAHELVAAMYEHFPSEFSRTMFGEEILDHGNNAALIRYWNKHREDDPRLARHPAVRDDAWRQWLVPLAVHGDGAPYKKTLPSPSLGICSWSSLLGVGENTIDSNFTWDVTPTKMTCKASRHNGLDTQTCRMDIMAWDFQALLSGKWPERDFGGNLWPNGSIQQQRAGSLLAGGYKFCVMQLRADLLHQCNEWQFTHYHGEDRRRVLNAHGLRVPHSLVFAPTRPFPSAPSVWAPGPVFGIPFAQHPCCLWHGDQPAAARRSASSALAAAAPVAFALGSPLHVLLSGVSVVGVPVGGPAEARVSTGGSRRDSEILTSKLRLKAVWNVVATALNLDPDLNPPPASSHPRPRPLPQPDSISEPAKHTDTHSAPTPRLRTPTSSGVGPD